MNFGLLIILLILIGYIGSVIYLNSKVKLGKDKHHELPTKQAPLRDVVNIAGLGCYGFLLLALLLFAIGVIFFRDSFLPR